MQINGWRNRFLVVGRFVFLVSALALQPLATRSQESRTVDSTIVLAKTAFLTCEILFPKSEKGSFSGELNEILRVADTTRIWSVFRSDAATQAELIIKIVEDRTLGSKWTITLYVYDPEDNRELYKEERNFVTLSNDVARLMNHLVDAVLEQRRQNREQARREADRMRAEEEANKEKAKDNYERGVGPAQITCESVDLFANRGAVRRVRRVLNRGDIVKITVLANEEVVVRIRDVVGYVDAQCVQLLPRRSNKD